MSGGLVLTVSILYLGLLFAIAQFVDHHAGKGRNFTRNAYVYTLSIAVYCTSWTFYGSVGLAATQGFDFLPIYLGPTLVFVLWSVVWVKIVRICKVHRITSIADFIASRYGKHARLGGLVTIIAVIGTTPYISLQLKSIATSFRILVDSADGQFLNSANDMIYFVDTTLIVALILALFAILFGTRHIDASEHHEGLVAAIAFESVVKLIAFLMVGFFVTYGLYGGFADLFERAREHGLDTLFAVNAEGNYSRWITMTLLPMAAIICLPRQFYITAVENPDESFLRKATWLFPLYLLVINVFVLPIALAGRIAFDGVSADADMYVLTVPLINDQALLALIVFVGGLSAATSMVIVASIALATMICNDLIMPLLLRTRGLNINKNDDLTGLLLTIRRISILIILFLGYIYYLFASESYSLVTIGLVSFAGAAQFAPLILVGIFWKGASYQGAITGLALGFVVWTYTLLLPSFAQSGWLPLSFIEDGPYGITFLKPYSLFGLDVFDRLTHSLFWSMFVNIGALWTVSLLSRQTAIERIQGALFVDVFVHTDDERDSRYWRGSATVSDLQQLVGRFVGMQRAAKAFDEFASERNINLKRNQSADAALLDFAEKLLAGAIGSATARVMVGTVVKGEIVGLDEVYRILDETSQVIEYSHRLEQKSAELEQATAQLRTANERLKELDSLKDHFLSMVSHELRTPLTSLRAFGEILVDNPEVSQEERERFLNVIVKESSRLTRLIDQLLDLARMEAGEMDWSLSAVDVEGAISEAMAALDGLIQENGVVVRVDIPQGLRPVRADRDQLMQVVINLVSNAIKFCDKSEGHIEVTVGVADKGLQVSVADNGKGIPDDMIERVFDKFHQSIGRSGDKPQGSGLGLAICREIITFFGGKIWVANRSEGGAIFTFTLPDAELADVQLSAE
ncbi:sensor histidine kinase [Sneathiella sp.]|uniref:sensor histidine kinase n=1 Tax=Sneathiella sp. TaxID=1964365 RepID=UPI002FE2E893